MGLYQKLYTIFSKKNLIVEELSEEQLLLSKLKKKLLSPEEILQEFEARVPYDKVEPPFSCTQEQAYFSLGNVYFRSKKKKNQLFSFLKNPKGIFSSEKSFYVETGKKVATENPRLLRPFLVSYLREAILAKKS